jgi:hypothetical protein
MRTPSIVSRSLYREQPLLVEVALVTATLAAVSLWFDGTQQLTSVVLPTGLGGSVGIWAHLAVLLVGTAVFVVAYSRFRGVELRFGPPALDSLPAAGVAVFAPAALVLLTDAFAGALGGRYSALSGTRWTAGAPPEVVLTLVVLAPLAGSVALALVFQGAVQGTFREVLSARRAAVLTVGFGAVALVDGTGGALGFFPSTGGFVFLVLLVVALLVGRYVERRAETGWDRRVGYAPLAALLALGVYGVFGEVSGLADVAFVCLQVTVLALAAWGYDRTDSLVVPAGTYLAFFATGQAVALLFEAMPAPA